MHGIFMWCPVVVLHHRLQLAVEHGPRCSPIEVGWRYSMPAPVLLQHPCSLRTLTLTFASLVLSPCYVASTSVLMYPTCVPQILRFSSSTEIIGPLLTDGLISFKSSWVSSVSALSSSKRPRVHWLVDASTWLLMVSSNWDQMD